MIDEEVKLPPLSEFEQYALIAIYISSAVTVMTVITLIWRAFA
jgi:hypothetical protein